MWPFRDRSSNQPSVHRGRIWRDDALGWWRYRCLNCDYGAGSRIEPALVRSVTVPRLIELANDHADPNHWSRRKYSGVRCV